MSRSFKKNPISGISCFESEKFEKQKYNRRMRNKNKVNLKKDLEIFFTKKEIQDRYEMRKEVKMRWNNLGDYKAWMK
jgi:hypothetical protein